MSTRHDTCTTYRLRGYGIASPDGNVGIPVVVVANVILLPTMRVERLFASFIHTFLEEVLDRVD